MQFQYDNDIFPPSSRMLAHKMKLARRKCRKPRPEQLHTETSVFNRWTLSWLFEVCSDGISSFFYFIPSPFISSHNRIRSHFLILMKQIKVLIVATAKVSHDFASFSLQIRNDKWWLLDSRTKLWTSPVLLA